MEEEPLTKALEENPIHEKMQVNLEELHAQRLFWKFHNRFTLYVGFFYCVNYGVNANKKMDGKFLKLYVAYFVTIIQLMHLV
jgi:hypothetical protein